MGTSHTVEQFAHSLFHAANATEHNQAKILREGALAAKRIFLETSTAKGVHPGGKIARKKWNVRFDVLHATTQALVRFTGPFHLVDRDTNPHAIVPRHAQALMLAPDVFAESAIHPGTPGKHIFPAGREVIQKTVPKLMASRFHATWAQSFR